MYVHSQGSYLKVYQRDNGTQYYVLNGARQTVRSNQKLYRQKPCKEKGMRRSRKSGRCRKVKSARKPCKEGTRRSRKSGRCHKIKSASKFSRRKPCAEGARRSRKTGRCRKIRKSAKKLLLKNE